MASYKSYSKRTTRVSEDTTANDLFEELISNNSQSHNKAISPTAGQSFPTKPKLTSKIGSLPREPKECPPPVTQTEKTSSEVTRSSWSRRRYEYSFSPR